MTSAISCPLWLSVYECQRVECAFTSPVRTECGMFVVVNVMLSLMSVMSPHPALCKLSVRTDVKLCILALGVSLVS